MADIYDDFEDLKEETNSLEEDSKKVKDNYADDYEDLVDKAKKNTVYSDEKDDDKQEPEEDFEEESNPLVRKFQYFFDKYYKAKLEKLIQDYPNKKSLLIDFSLLEQFDPGLADELIDKPEYIQEAMEIAAKKYKSSLLDEKKEFEPVLRIFNIPQDKKVLIKYISSSHIGKLVCFEGIVKQFTTVLPKLKVAHWICKKCGNELNLHQEGLDVIKPKMCPECKHKDFMLDEKNSEFQDYQKLEMQDLLEELKGGEQASTMQVYVHGDLVNTFTAGERLVITGTLKLRTPQELKQTVFGQYILCSSIESSKQDYESVEITKEDEEKIKEFSKNPEIYNLLIDSIAPHIQGHNEVKEAIALQLFGGVRKILKHKSKIRGNIHVLIVGDPGVGKSQVLLAATQIAPKSIYIAGKTASGAGLTATAVKDEFGEGGWTLKAGALVLANGGFAMIDEFDKMDAEDRSAMHEALEQETVSIAKAGIVTSFKTETSVLAAANPKYGRFDAYKTIPEQIEVPPTLMSRFDLFFVLQDIVDEKKDLETINSILKTHKSGELMRKGDLENLNDRDQGTLDKMNATTALDSEFLKKYIAYGRTKIFPVLTENAIKIIQKFFISLRQKSQGGRVTVTFRQLEALVRLSEASAKIRLSEHVADEDANRAISLFKRSMEQVGLDPETGTFDIDIITTGQSHNQTSRLMKIVEIINNIVKDQNGQCAKFDAIVQEAEKEGLDKAKVRELLEKLQKVGDIYEPKAMCYMATKKD